MPDPKYNFQGNGLEFLRDQKSGQFAYRMVGFSGRNFSYIVDFDAQTLRAFDQEMTSREEPKPGYPFRRVYETSCQAFTIELNREIQERISNVLKQMMVEVLTEGECERITEKWKKEDGRYANVDGDFLNTCFGSTDKKVCFGDGPSMGPPRCKTVEDPAKGHVFLKSLFDKEGIDVRKAESAKDCASLVTY